MESENNPGRKNGGPGPNRVNPVEPEEARSRDGGDEALTGLSPADSRLDEKVIVNEQRSNKAVNTPSQTAANPSESNSYDEEITDDI